MILLAVALGAGAAYGGGRTLWQDGGVRLCGPSAGNPAAATSDSAGGAAVVWMDSRVWPSGVYAQRVDAAGVPQWAENGVLLRDSIGAGSGDVTHDGEHGVIAVWSATYSGPSLFAQRVNADGSPLWGSNGLMLRPYVGPGLSQLAALVRDGHGGAIVVWNAFTSSYSEVDTLIACRLDSSGTKQ